MHFHGLEMSFMHLTIYFTTVHLVYMSASLTINSVQIKDSAVPTKGSNIQLVCSISGFTSNSVVSWYKTDTQTIPDGTRSQVKCIPNKCIDALPGYTYTADASNMYVTIKDLRQTTERKWWTCRYETQSKALQLVVYTVPQSLLYDRVPSDSQDLSTNSVSLECKSSCAYPAPNFVWYYTETGGSRQQYTTPGVAGEETGSTCTDLEKLYTSSLTLPRFTTFTGNADKTVKIECGIPIFPGRDTALYTPLSPDITFAVKTMSVTLRDGSSQPTNSSVITVTSGSPKTLTCSPSLSRPEATLVWYIDNVEKQRSSSTSFTFTPSDNDHDKQVYCKAFNIPPESQAVFSERHKLYVRVQVSSITLSPILNNKIEVTSGVEKTLTCTPGTSRPSATIVWYIGTTKQSTTGTSFSFTPSNNDHDKTVYCKAYNIQPEQQAVSSATPRLYVKVKTMSVTLRDGSSQPTNSSVITVTSGSPKTLTCSPSLSRPEATLVWYIDNVEKQRSSSTSFTFTPSDNDHDKQVYCKAFNIPPESQAVFSERHKLYVRVQVSSITLSPILNNKIEVTSGVEKTLTCTPGTSRPNATIVWYIGTTKQSTTGTSFSFTPSNNDHDKTVYCKAYTIQPEQQAVSSATPRLYVRVLATTPTLVNQTAPGNLILLSRDVVKLVCASSATRPAATVTWKKGTTLLGSGEVTQSPETGSLVSVTSVLTITPANDDNNQIIRCETRVSEQANTPSVQETIEVWWSASTISIRPNLPLPWRYDQTGNYLTCVSSNYGNPASTTNWTSQYGTPDEATRRLSFPHLSHVYDTSDVICELSNGYTQKKGVRVFSPTLNLDVQYKPIVTIKRNNVVLNAVTVNEGQSLSVSCTAVGNPDPSVRWTSKPTGGGLLQFTDIDRQDDKPYICRASATSTHYPSYSFVTQKTLDVTVNFAPEITADLSTSSLEENSSVNIICNAVGRPTAYTYTDLVQTWRDAVIPNTHSNLAGTERYRSLTLTSLQLQDTGNYTCHVNNGIKDRTGKLNQTGNIYLKVKVSPKVLPIQENFAGALGDTVNIGIPFYSYPAAVEVTFVKQGGGPIQNGNRHTISYPPTPVLTRFYGQDVILDGNTAILQITALRVEDFANYTLTIINSIGSEVYMCSLNSQSKPLPPKTFVYLGLFDGVPQFYWEQGFNGGHVQLFIIETTTVGTSNWMKHEAVEEGDKLYQQENKSYIANITGLEAGQYSARLTAENKLGSVEVSDRPTVTFTIPETRIHACACSKGNNTAEIIGAFVGGIALTVMVLAAIFIVRRQRQLGKSNTNCQYVEDASKDQHVYYNMSATGQTTEDITLKESDSDTDTATYETTMSSNPS